MTHEHIKALDELIAAVEAGDLTDVNRKLGAMFATDHSLAWDWVSNVNSAFRGSLDAANELHEALLPGWDWKVESYGGNNFAFVGMPSEMLFRDPQTSLDYPARAWLIAILKAYRAITEGSE